MSDVDRFWTAYSFAIVAVTGSWFTVMAAGAAIWAAISLALQRYRLNIPAAAYPAIVCAILLGSWAILIGTYHDGSSGFWRGLVYALPLFSLPALISRFRASDQNQSFQTMTSFAATGLILGACLAALQFLMKQPVEAGTGNAYVFGFVIASLLILSVFGNQRRRSIYFKIVIVSIGFFALHIAGSRTHLIYLFILIFTYVVFSGLHKKIKLAVLVTLFAAVIYSRESIAQLFSEVFSQSSDGPILSFGIRLELWTASAAVIKDAPLLGVGFENKMSQIMTQMPEYLSYVQFTHVHNDFLDSALSRGLPAMTLLILFYISSFYMMQNLEPAKRLSGHAFIGLCIVHGSFGPVFTHDIVGALFIVVLSIFAGCSSEDPAFPK